MFQKISRALIIVVSLIVGAALHFYLPSTAVAYLVGSEVKRTESKKNENKLRDVRYVVARRISDSSTLMFRNEDMSWPPYFKFDSGTLSGKAMDWSDRNPKPPVLVTYYGWRIPFLSMYPNATSLEIVDQHYNHIPWFNIVFLSLILFLLVFVRFKLKK
jgi:hypothetical protein